MPTKIELGLLGIMSARITERMEALGLNALSTAKKAGLGNDYVRDLLRGKVKQPSAMRLSQLAEALETTADYLMGGPEQEAPATRPLQVKTGERGQAVAGLTRLITGHELEVAFPVYCVLCEAAAAQLTARCFPLATEAELWSITGLAPGVSAFEQSLSGAANYGVMASVLRAAGFITAERRKFLLLLSELRAIWYTENISHQSDHVQHRLRTLLEYAGVPSDGDDEQVLRLKLGYSIVDFMAEAAPVKFDVDAVVREVIAWRTSETAATATPNEKRGPPRN